MTRIHTKKQQQQFGIHSIFFQQKIGIPISFSNAQEETIILIDNKQIKICSLKNNVGVLNINKCMSHRSPLQQMPILQVNKDSLVQQLFKNCKNKIGSLLQLVSSSIQSNELALNLSCISYTTQNNKKQYLWVKNNRKSNYSIELSYKQLEKIIQKQIDNECIQYRMRYRDILKMEQCFYYKIKQLFLGQIYQVNEQNLNTSIQRAKSRIKSLKYYKNSPKIVQKADRKSCNKTQRKIRDRLSLNKITTQQTSSDNNQLSLKIQLTHTSTNNKLKLKPTNSPKTENKIKKQLKLRKSSKYIKMNNDTYLRNTLRCSKQQNIIQHLSNIKNNYMNDPMPTIYLNKTSRLNRSKSIEQNQRIKNSITQIFDIKQQQEKQVHKLQIDILKQGQILQQQKINKNIQIDQNKLKEHQTILSYKQQSQKYKNQSIKKIQSNKQNQKQNTIQKYNYLQAINNKIQVNIDLIGQSIPKFRKLYKYNSQLPLFLLYKKFLYLRTTFISLIAAEQPPYELLNKITQKQWNQLHNSKQFKTLLDKYNDENKLIYKNIQKLQQKIIQKNHNLQRQVVDLIIDDPEIYEKFIQLTYKLNSELIIKQLVKINQESQQIWNIYKYFKVLILALFDDLSDRQINKQLFSDIKTVVQDRFQFNKTKIICLIQNINTYLL